MIVDRRAFLVRTGLSLGAGALASSLARARALPSASSVSEQSSWADVRAEFSLRPDLIHMTSFLLASHPRPVRDAIERHRRGLDEDPVGYLFQNDTRLEADVLAAAADHLGVAPDEIALTDSTTMGLGLLYGGLRLRPDQEIVTTVHDHYSTDTSLRLRAERTGATVRRVALYDEGEGAKTSVEEVVARLKAAVGPKTRIVAVTWVHSCTGVKLPIRAMADALAEANRGRAEGDRVLLCVDGVHGLGIDDVRMSDLGCDFFIAGTHKWMFGPRGTGLVWGRADAWPVAQPTIPTFSGDAYQMWMNVIPAAELPMSEQMTPGGFHSFEHRWALNEAFRFHKAVGRARLAERIHALNRQLKEGLASMPRVKLHTPVSDELSGGIVCFEVEGLNPLQLTQGLRERRIVASITPYATLYGRLAPSLMTSTEDVEETLRAVRALA